MANHRTAQGTASHITVTQSKLSIVLGRRNSALLNDHFDQHSGEVQGLGDNSGGGGAGGKDKPWLPRGRDPAAGVTKGGVGIPHSHGAAPGQGCRLPGPSSDFLTPYLLSLQYRVGTMAGRTMLPQRPHPTPWHM